MAEVEMIASVKTWDDEYIAGESYDLDDEIADTLIVKGYATGTPSREYTDSEVSELKQNDQTVGR